ncbi:hypothetical protein JCM10450v2_006950 [Rhodotorula kratochvilovae]
MADEQEFKIQPHPAKSNFPGSDAEATPGLGGAPNLAHLHQQDALGGRGGNPHITDAKLEQPKSHDELQRLQAQLNDRAAESRPGSSMEGSAGEL